MIKEQTIKIKIHSPKYYNLNDIKQGDVVDLDVNKLSKGSHVKITAICDICRNEKTTAYKDYNKMTQKDGLYYCVKCRKIKTKNSNLDKYGVENVMQIEEVKEKMYETNLEKYGHKCSAQSEEIKEKSKNTCIEKYGVETFLKTEEMREKVKKTNIERYGVENVMQNKEIRNKQINTMFEKYGVENVSELFKRKDMDNFVAYSLNVRKYTKKYKKKLLENWDGYDYYDDEYIKDNFEKYNYSDSNYPTIDHKISVFYGYENGISAKDLSNGSNLCITKRHINSSKGKKTTYEFLKNDKNIMETKIICIIDRSSSMGSIKKDAIDGFNIFLEEQQGVDAKANMDILLFDTQFIRLAHNKDIREVKPLTNETYHPQSCTALYDAIGLSIDAELDRIAEGGKRFDKTLCVILTDGEENSSKQYHQSMVKNMINEMEEEFGWDIIFLAANQDAVLTADGMGIKAGKAMNFEATDDGINVAYQNISKATTFYRTTDNDNYDNIFNDSNK